MSDQEKFYAQILEKSRHALKQFESLTKPLMVSREQKSDANKLIGGLKALVGKEGHEAQQNLHNFVDLILLMKKSIEFTQVTLSDDLEALKREDRITNFRRRSEQIAEWKKYGHSVARWSISVVIAVALYSIAVNAADEWKGVIHVPVHEWVQQLGK